MISSYSDAQRADTANIIFEIFRKARDNNLEINHDLEKIMQKLFRGDFSVTNNIKSIQILGSFVEQLEYLFWQV